MSPDDYKFHPPLTRAERLLKLLGDGYWHDTDELVERVGHAFAEAKYRLVHGGTKVAALIRGTMIEVRHHPNRRHQFQYRLVVVEPKVRRRRRRPQDRRLSRRRSQPKGGDSV